MNRRRQRCLSLLVLAPLIALLVVGCTTCSDRHIARVMRETYAYAPDGVIQGAESFHLPGGRTGCLLIHGFPGTPAEMRGLGETLHNAGYTVLGLRLPGFGTSPLELRHKTWRDWCDAGAQGLAALQQECDRVYVVGFSTGGLVALELAAHHQPAGIVSLSAFIRPRNKLANLGRIPVLKQLVPWIVPYWRAGSGLAPNAATANIAYPYVPLKASLQVLDLAGVVRRDLARVQVPVLIVQSKDDPVVDPASALVIQRQVRSPIVQLHWLNRSGHVVTLGPEQAALQACILAFIADRERQP